MAATLKDVAKMCGVHPSTVSRVLRNKENIPISKETREKIFKAVNEINYQPDQTARALRLKKSNVIGLIIPNISSPYFSGIAKTMELECSKIGYTLNVCDTNEEQEKEILVVNDLLSRGVDGLVIAPVQDSDQHIRALVEKKFPLVLIDRCFDDFETNAVICNDEASAYNALSILNEMGHERIGFIGGRPNLYPVVKRLQGYKKAINVYELNDGSELILGGEPTLQSGYESALKLLNFPNPPTVFLISGSIVTLGVIKAILEKGLSIPEDISIIGFTDTIYSPYLVCPLTTISHPVQEIGKRAIKLLLDNINNKDSLQFKKILVEAEINIRKSTGQHIKLKM